MTNSDDGAVLIAAAALVAKLTAEIDTLKARERRLIQALHAAINQPKGVVPSIADEFYRWSHPAFMGDAE